MTIPTQVIVVLKSKEPPIPRKEFDLGDRKCASQCSPMDFITGKTH
jgi:hypothetical protein